MNGRSFAMRWRKGTWWAVIACLSLVPTMGCGDDDGDNNNANTNGNGVCGDGRTDSDEQCDDGAENSDTAPDACRTNCRLHSCGDGVVDTGEACDDSNQNDNDDCVQDCVLNVCGDGFVNETTDGTRPAEQCDDGNTADGDDCRGDCQQNMTLCGNGSVDPGEQCDSGGQNNDTAPNRCRTTCQLPSCGDDVRDDDSPYDEECDGTDFGGATCNNRGLPGGGALNCASCATDDSGCCQDSDGDGRGLHCDLGADECDGDGSNWTASGCASCADTDGDGYRGVGCDDSEDACEGDAFNWTASGCTDCHDDDGDGGRGTDCDRAEDCDDTMLGIQGPCQANGCPQGWAYIPAGPFEMGCNDGELDDSCRTNEQPRHTVTLDPYCIEITEVTVSDFRGCLNAAVCTGTPTDSSTEQWCNWSSLPQTIEDHPINCLTLIESRQYCQSWLGGDLPTEAQWEKAARGGSGDTRKYPWGDSPDPDCTRCNYDAHGIGVPFGCDENTWGPGTWEVGRISSAGDSPYGLKDMAGNVWERVRDYYTADFYNNCASGCTNPVNNDASSGFSVVRGDAFDTPSTAFLRTVGRGQLYPENRYYSVGLRCSRVP